MLCAHHKPNSAFEVLMLLFIMVPLGILMFMIGLVDKLIMYIFNMITFDLFVVDCSICNRINESIKQNKTC